MPKRKREELLQKVKKFTDALPYPVAVGVPLASLTVAYVTSNRVMLVLGVASTAVLGAKAFFELDDLVSGQGHWYTPLLYGPAAPFLLAYKGYHLITD